MTHQDRKKILELLEGRGWKRHPSHSRGTRGVRVKGRAWFDVLAADDQGADVLCRLSPTQLGSGAWISRPRGRGWHGRLVDALEAFAARTEAPARVSSSDVVVRAPGEPWPSLEASVPGYVKHVLCEGARRHVLSHQMSSRGVVVARCSEPTCIYNAPGPEGG